MSGPFPTSDLIASGQFVIRIGPFSIRIHSAIPSVQQGILELYSAYSILPPDTFCDFYVRLIQPSGVRRFFRKQVLFAFDQFIPFKPLPYAQAFPFFEWGLNWCISGYSHRFLIVHAAVVERNGKALILPGAPGSGKSTLCAALINNGWRLLSDELTLVDRVTGHVVPVPRPVSLKNESITVIADTFPSCQFSPIVHDTLKGSVCLMKPPADSVVKADQTAIPCMVVFPKFQAESFLSLTAVPKAEAFMRLADLSFNYSVLGAQGFETMAGLVRSCEAYDFIYDGDFNQASDLFVQLLDDVQ